MGDPLSIAGLGLSAVSLAFQLFAGCIKGFVLLSTAHNLGKDSSTLLCMLNLQEIQLTDWARRAGLLSATHALDRRLNQTVVHAVLQELQKLLLDTDKLKSRYKLALSAIPSTNDLTVSSTMERGILGAAISENTRKDILVEARLIQSSNHFPQRLWWAAVDKSKFEEYIAQIRFFVQELWHLLDPLRQDEMASGLQVILSHVISMSDRLGDMKSLQDALRTSGTQRGTADSGSYSSLESAAEIKAITLSINADSEGRALEAPLSSEMNIHAVQLASHPLQDFAPFKSNPDMGTARYDGKCVFIEWKTLPVHARHKIMTRVKDLAILLGAPKHPSFRSLRCKGLVRDTDDSKIAFVFEIPEIYGCQPPRPLRTMFGSISPSVTERLQLALRITESVRQFHTGGWLHKNLRSENILLFPSGNASMSAEFPLTNPVLAGFAFSRLDSPSAISEQPSADPQRDIYRHPDAMGEPSKSFTVVKDVYALGTVLLEIGEWRSLKSLVEKIVDVGKADVTLIQLAKVKPFLLDDGPKGGLRTLKFRMGDVYTLVTRMMLSGEIPEQAPVNKESSEIHTPSILDIAVRELGRCII
ncbi:MAG: hypothetical protein Q9201_007020 [Fulgogasparrea decipioides]